MHELSLAQELVDQVDAIRLKENARTVTSITVNIGALSGVDREAFDFAFPLAIEGTALAGAVLVIEETPATVMCEKCGRPSQPALDDIHCRACGSRRVHITAGRDFLIQSVELRQEG